MTDIQKRFVEEYCIDGNGTQAAIRAGYSKSTARQIAYELKNTKEIADAIKERYTALSMTAEQATKHISDIAATRLNDYMVVKKVLKQRMVRKSLKVLIAELQAEIDLEADWFDLADFDEKEQNIHFAEQQDRKRKILRYTLELKKDPKAYRDVPVVDYEKIVTLDLEKLAKADEQGNISELSWTEFGPKVKLYSAADALSTVLQMNGKLVQKHEHGGIIGVEVDTSELTDEQRAALLAVARKVK